MDTPKNSKSRPPSFQFYPSDWLNDAKLQICSLKSLGVLINLMCLMHEGDPYGYLSVNGRKMSPKEVQKLAKIGSKSYNFCTSELLQNGVLKCDETYGLFCERMVKDHRLRTIRKESGLKGGNPNLVNQNEKNKDKQTVNQNPTPSSSTSSSSSKLSKDNSPIGEDVPKKTYGNPEINEILEKVKIELSLPELDGSEKANRYAAQRWRTKLINSYEKKHGKKPERVLDMVEFVLNCVKSNNFWSNKITKIETLEKNWVQILTSSQKKHEGGFSSG